jgi:signal transduction histidine kinase
MIRFNRYYLSGAIGLTVCMLGAFLTLAVNVESRARMFRVIGESESREAAIRQFMGLIVDAETAQRSYLLTSDPNYLRRYEAARLEVGPALERIHAGYTGGSVQHRTETVRANLRRLRTLSADRMNEMAATLALQSTASPEAASALVRTDLSKESMNELRAVATDLEKDEATLRGLELNDWTSSLFVGRLMLAGGTALNLALIVGSVVLVNRDLRRREEQARQLERYSDELEEQVKRRTAALSELSSHLQNVAEREKAAIARELHDELGGLMIAAKMDISWLERRLASPDDDVKLRWDRLRKMLNDGLNLKRRVVETLRPTLLDNMGLVPAIQWIYQETCGRAGLRCSEQYAIDQLRLRDDAAISVFRVIQESLVNIVKHAKASEVDLKVGIDGPVLAISLRDNGVGMPQGTVKAGSQGLSSMRHRVTSLGGTWRMSSPEGGGTAIDIRLPLEAIVGAPEATPAETA